MRLLGWALLVLVLILIAGCQTVDTKPAAIAEPPRTINVPVRAPCIDLSNIPTVPSRTKVAQDADEEQLAAAVASYVGALEAYAPQADALLRACSK